MKQQDMIVCRCEEVSYFDLKETIAKYQCSAREAKLRTRAGMGYCGGRTCRHLVELTVLEASEKRKPSPGEILLKYQPPIRPLTFGQLGGRGDNE